MYDQLMWGYGCNSVEAWGMGIPVIAGADQWTIRRMSDLWKTLPFVAAQPMRLKGVIRKMVKSKQMRDDAAGVGLAHVLKYHDELPSLAILAELYGEAMKVRSRPRIEGKGVVFRSSRHKAMDFDGIRVDFTKGAVEVTDVEVVARSVPRQRLGPCSVSLRKRAWRERRLSRRACLLGLPLIT